MIDTNEFYGNIDTLGNYFSNLRVLAETTSEIENKSNMTGLITYNSEEDVFVGVLSGNQIKTFNQGDSFSNVIAIRRFSGNVELIAEGYNDTLLIEEGDNIRFEVTQLENRLKINANLNYTANNFFQVFGDTANTDYLITHNLGTSNVVVSVLWENESNVNPNTQILRYVTEDENTVKVVLSEPPTSDNSLKAVINSRHGDKGFQGRVGLQGFQGNQGNQGRQGIPGNIGFQYTPGDTNKTIRVNSGGNLQVNDTIQIIEVGNTKRVELNTQYSEIGLSVKSANTSNVITGTLVYDNSIVDFSNIKILTLNRLNTSTNITDNLFDVGPKGDIFSKDLIGSSNSLVMATTDGVIKRYEESELSNIFIPRRNKIILPSASLLNSFTINPILVPPIAGKSIIVHSVTGRLLPGSTPFDFGARQVTIEVQTCNDPMIVLNTELLDYDNSIPGFDAIFHYTISKTATPGSMFTRQNLPVVLKTYTSNPSVGNGSLELWVYYNYI